LNNQNKEMMSANQSKIIIILIILFQTIIVKNSFSQQQIFPIDTSFTTQSAYQKEVKNYPFITIAQSCSEETVTIKRELVYARYGNRKMMIDLYLPPQYTKGNHPAVLILHGGGWQSGNKSMDAPMATYLSSKGFVCATPEYRLSAEAKYPAAMVDLKTAVRWLRENSKVYSIDTNRIAVLGTSSGGQLAALMGATNQTAYYCNNQYVNHSSDVQAVIDIDGILAFIHPESGEGVDKPGKLSAATQWLGVSMDEDPQRWKEASALTHAGKTFPPVLFINSQFPRFHAGRDDLIARLDSLGINSEVHQLNTTPHPFWLFNPWFEPTANWCLQFLNKQFNPR
jgi:acetyl esterase/lipase